MRAGKGFVTEPGHVDVVCGEAFSAPESHDLTELDLRGLRLIRPAAPQTAGATTGRPAAAAASASTGDGPAGLGPLKALSRQDSSLAGAGHRPLAAPQTPATDSPRVKTTPGLPQPGDGSAPACRRPRAIASSCRDPHPHIGDGPAPEGQVTGEPWASPERRGHISSSRCAERSDLVEIEDLPCEFADGS